MPKLDDPIHLDMYRAATGARTRFGGLWRRLRAMTTGGRHAGRLYGYEWGDPDQVPPLARVRDHFLLPYAQSESNVVEIGPGGGRWTQYLLAVRRLYVVDYHQELLDELRRNFDEPNMVFVHNHGTDFPGIPDQSIDFLFSFGVFVHLDLELVESYLASMRRILKPGANAVIQYADQNKVMAQENPGFADNDPDRMNALIDAAGFSIREEDRTSLWHSSVVRFGPVA